MSKRHRNREDRRRETLAVACGPSQAEGPANARRYSRWGALVGGAIIALAGLLAYSNTFAVPEILDDPGSISQNPHIRQVWPITKAIKAPAEKTVAGRPVLALSLAINYAISELDVWSYHAFNLTVHVIAALTLFGIVRRTLASRRLGEVFATHATLLAFVCALIWVLHPLQTQAVTYMIQRAESMMGMFYLLTLYCAIRGSASSHSLWWYGASVIFCALGMGTKEVMATAPLMVLIYDRIFISESFRDLLKRRLKYHVPLWGTWVILGAILISAPRSRTAGFQVALVGPIQYAFTQPRVILHYLSLAFFPRELVLDYAWPIAEKLSDILIPSAVILILLVGTITALRYAPPLGFLGVWFFLILAPSSSFVPIKDLAFEHRMYLSLAGPVVGVVICGYYLIRRTNLASRNTRLSAGLLVCLILAAVLGWRTYERNKDYRSERSIWSDTLTKVPHNPRAHGNMAVEYSKEKNYEKALYHYNKLLELNPRYIKGYDERGILQATFGKYDLAMRDFNAAIALDPGFASAYRNRGLLWGKKGRIDRAIEDYTTAIRLEPDSAKPYFNRADSYMLQGRFNEAIADLTKAIGLPKSMELHRAIHQAYHSRGRAYIQIGRYDLALNDLSKVIELKGPHPDAYNNRAIVYHKLGRDELAIADCTRAVALDPAYTTAYVIRGISLERMKRYEAAVEDFDRALSLNPKVKEAYTGKAIALTHLGRDAAIIENWREAVRNHPGWEKALRSLAWYLGTSSDESLRDGSEALLFARRAVQISRPPSPESLDALGAAWAETGRFQEAIEPAQRALEIARAAGRDQLAREIAARIELYKINRPYRSPKGAPGSM